MHLEQGTQCVCLKARRLNHEHVCPTQTSWSENVREVLRWILCPEGTQKGHKERVVCQADTKAHLTLSKEAAPGLSLSNRSLTSRQRMTKGRKTGTWYHAGCNVSVVHHEFM